MTDWAGLLKWSLQYTDGTSNSSARPLSDEDRKFLQKVMEDMVRDEIKAIKSLLDGIKEKKTDIGEALEELSDLVEPIDYSLDFIKLGGLHVILPLLASEDPEIRKRAASLIALLAQNNPSAQTRILEVDALPGLAMLANNESDPACRAKAVLAISALVRNHNEAHQPFIELGGIECLTNIIKSDQGSARDKALFFLPYAVTIPGAASKAAELNLPSLVSEICFQEDELKDGTSLLHYGLDALEAMSKQSETKAQCQTDSIRQKLTMAAEALKKHAAQDAEHEANIQIDLEAIQRTHNTLSNAPASLLMLQAP